MTAFRERLLRPAEAAEGSLTEANWVRLKKLVDWARLWEMPERQAEGGLDGFGWRIEGRNHEAITHRSAGRRAAARSTN